MRLRTCHEESLTAYFIYSPFYEMICSLHVLCKPEHHLGRLKWAEETQRKLSPSFFQELLFFDQHFDGWLGVMDFANVSEEINDLNVPLVIESIGLCPLSKFSKILCNENKPPEGIIINETLRRRLIACLKTYFFTYFEPELRYMEPLLIRIQKKQALVCEELGIKDYISTLHNRIEVTDKNLTLYKYRTFTFPFQELKSVTISISSFIPPHLMVGMSDPANIHLTFHAQLQEISDSVPVDLVKTLKALGDGTRLKILRAIRQKPCSTQSLALELDLTEACISKHLKQLSEAELLYRQRKGNYVYYLLNPLQLDRIPMDIFQYLD